MPGNRGNKCIIVVVFVFVILIAVVTNRNYTRNMFTVFNYTCRLNVVRNNIMSGLVYNKYIYNINEYTNDAGYIIYVLGGSQDTLINTYKCASELYKKNIIKYIFILDRHSNKKYYPIMNKYYTNNEWSLNELGIHGVKRESIRFVSIPKSVFGTFTEAEEMTKIAAKYNYRKIILVTSEYHTKRAFNAFYYFSRKYNLEIFVYGSKDDIDIGDYFVEFMKNILYDHLLLWSSLKNPFQTSANSN